MRQERKEDRSAGEEMEGPVSSGKEKQRERKKKITSHTEITEIEKNREMTEEPQEELQKKSQIYTDKHNCTLAIWRKTLTVLC